jgi:hypothetical protein
MSDHEKCPDNPNCDATNTEAKSPDAPCTNATNNNETTPRETTPDAATPENTISDRKLHANQENARKSTGPRTAQGKAKASRNALKHGMTAAKEGLFSNDAQLCTDRLESWKKAAKPRNDMELYQLESAVRASVNLDRCARNAKADLDRRERGAVGHWDGEQTKKVNRAIKHWSTQPAACVRELETFTRGVEWLLACWEDLAQVLEAKEYWSLGDFWLAMRLMGKSPEMRHEGDKEVSAFRTLVIAALPEIEPGDMDLFLCIKTSQLDPEACKAQFDAELPSREDALEGLWATFNAEVERLSALREKLWERTDWPALAQKINLSAFDNSKAGVLRRRYESANHLDMHRCLKQLTEQRKQHEIRVEEEREEQREIEEIAKLEKRAELNRRVEQRQRERLRNEPKSSVTKDKPVSTSGKSADVDLREISDPAKVIEKVMGAKAAAFLSPRPSNPAAPGAGEGQKPS